MSTYEWDLAQPPPFDLIAHTIGTAADLMEEGWCQGQSWCQIRIDGNLVDAYCASGALTEAAVRTLGGRAYRHLVEHLVGYVRWAVYDKIYKDDDDNKQYGSLWMWNDDVQREKQEVLDLFRKVEKDYLAKGDEE